MNIYVSHASAFDFQTELYQPLKATIGTKHSVFFPHDKLNDGTKSKDIIARSDVFFAEVSYPSTGQGIEMGWADTFDVPIICFYRAGMKPTSSLEYVTEDIFEYNDHDDMIRQLETKLADLN
jgi:hypothetical protein